MQDIHALEQGRPLLHASGVDLTKRNPLRAAHEQREQDSFGQPLAQGSDGAAAATADRTTHRRSYKHHKIGWWSQLPLGMRRAMVLATCVAVVLWIFSAVVDGLHSTSVSSSSQRTIARTMATAAQDPMKPAWAQSMTKDRFGWLAVAAWDQRLRFRWCPPGEAMLGSPVSELGRSADEIYRLEIVPTGFWIAETELPDAIARDLLDVPNADAAEPSLKEHADLPARNMSWYDAQTICQMLSQRLAAEVRLPSEVEWEYAARAGSALPFWGRPPEEAGLMAQGDIVLWWQEGLSNGIGYGLVLERAKDIAVGVRPVQQGTPNTWGLFNTLGNVAEWCKDLDQGDGVLRGGSWLELSDRCRLAARTIFPTDWADRATGLRVVIVP